MTRGQNSVLEQQVAELPGLRATAEELKSAHQGLLQAKASAEKDREELEQRVEARLCMDTLEPIHPWPRLGH